MSRWALVLVTMSGWSTAIIASIGALGEELGWRTYMYPKLEKLIGPAGSVIVGGIIWGIWHFPATIMHTVNNANSFPLAYFFDAEKLPGILKEPPVMMLIISVPQIIMGMIATMLIYKMKKEETE